MLQLLHLPLAGCPLPTAGCDGDSGHTSAAQALPGLNIQSWLLRLFLLIPKTLVGLVIPISLSLGFASKNGRSLDPAWSLLIPGVLNPLLCCPWGLLVHPQTFLVFPWEICFSALPLHPCAVVSQVSESKSGCSSVSSYSSDPQSAALWVLLV